MGSAFDKSIYWTLIGRDYKHNYNTTPDFHFTIHSTLIFLVYFH
jgi:hypothetical protein